MEEIITKSVSDYLGSSDKVLEVAKLYGDASYRTYFRTKLESGKTLVIMKLPDGLASVSEEITNYKSQKEELSYINISNFLRSYDLPVPEILFYDKETEALILEDVGDHIFWADVVDVDNGKKFEHYKRAIDLLCEIKSKAVDDGKCIAFKRSFDDTLLNWEFDHFLEYGVEARLGKKVGEDFKKEFDRITREVSKEIVEMNYIFTHRDYQSRNLMVRDSKLVILDFQDALMGPEAYDLVSLTRDSYVEISDLLLKKLVVYYCEKRGLDFKKFRMDFDLVTIQRKLKDAGRFVYIDRVKGNPNYLTHIPRSLESVKKALGRLSRYKDLLDILKPYVPEWNE